MRAFELVRRIVACLPLLTVLASAPMVAQTKTFTDTAIPVGIVSEPFYSIVDVLNKDRTITQYATQSISNAGYNCAPAPGLAAQTSTPHVFAYDANLFEIGPASSGSSLAIAPITSPYYNGCAYGPLAALPSAATSVLATAADTLRHRLFILASSGGSSPETVIGYDASTFYYSNTSALVSYGAANLDTGATYTAMVTDMDGAYGDTAITELGTSTTAGNLWIYTTAGRAVKVLAPDGSSLPAVNAFIIHNPNDLGGEILVLVNQDGLTATNQTNPPLDTNPFTLIDLGQLHQLIAASPSATTVTLPALTKISATTPYYAMLGGAWNPVNKLLYAVVGGADASGNIFRHVLTYDPYNPSTPNEIAVADVTSVPIVPPAYPQIALNAAAGSMQFLTQSPTAAYTVSLTSGASTAATQLGAGTFASDPGFAPTAMTVNPLAGNTWFASSSGKVDALTLPSTALVQAYLDVTAPEIVANTGTSSIHVLGYFPYNSDTNLSSTNVTVTATKQGGAPYTFGTAASTSVRVNGVDISGNFPSAGIYSLTASFPGDSVQAAFTSSPVIVYVATPPFTPALAVTAKAATSTTGTASVTLTGSSWVPTGTIKIADASSSAVLGTYTLSGPLANPISIPITFPLTTTRVVASYLGDSQNAVATSPSAPIAASVTAPTLTLSNIGTTVLAATSNNGTVTLGATTTTAPTGTVTIYYVPSGSTAQTVLTTVSASAAFSSSGAGFTYASPATPGNYTLYATYPGDSNYSAVTSAGTALNVLVAIATTTTVTVPATAAVNGVFRVNIKLASGASTQTPSGTLNVFAKLAGAATSTNIGIVDASQAYSASGNSFNATLPTAGVWTITASFYGDPYFTPSSGTATITIGATSLIATTLTLRSTVSLTVGNNYAAVVYLTPATLLSTAPTGNITLTATPTGGSPTSIGTVTPAQAMANGGYTVSVPTTIATTYTITATYPGDTNYAAATPVTSTTNVLGIATTLTPSALFPTAVPNFTNSISVLLKTASGTVGPTGNVLLTVTPSTGVTLSPASITATQAVSGSNVVNITYPANGVYTVTGAYSGDSIYAASSFTQTVTVQTYASSITLSGPATGVTPGAPINFQLLLSDANHNKYQAPAATGNVVVTSLSTTGVAGPGATVTAALASSTSGTTVPLQFTQAGTYTVTAAYAGDTVNLPSQATAQIAITATTTPTFVMTLTGSSSVNINDSPSTTSVTLTAYNGFNTPVALTFLNDGDTPPDTQDCCNITLTDAVTGLPVTNVTPTTAGAKINITFAKSPNASRLSSPYARVPGALACAVFCLTFVAFRRRGAAFQLKLLAAILIVAAAGTSLAGCGSGQSVLIVATPVNNSQGTAAPQSVLVMVSF